MDRWTDGPEERRTGTAKGTPNNVRCALSVLRSSGPSVFRLLDVLVDELRHLEHGNVALAAKDRLERLVGVDLPAVLGILKSLPLDVGPELLGDLGARNWRVADDGGERGIRLHRSHESSV